MTECWVIDYILQHEIKNLALSDSLYWIWTYENNCNPNGMFPEHIRGIQAPEG